MRGYIREVGRYTGMKLVIPAQPAIKHSRGGFNYVNMKSFTVQPDRFTGVKNVTRASNGNLVSTNIASLIIQLKIYTNAEFATLNSLKKLP